MQKSSRRLLRHQAHRRSLAWPRPTSRSAPRPFWAYCGSENTCTAGQCLFLSCSASGRRAASFGFCGKMQLLPHKLTSSLLLPPLDPSPNSRTHLTLRLRFFFVPFALSIPSASPSPSLHLHKKRTHGPKKGHKKKTLKSPAPKRAVAEKGEHCARSPYAPVSIMGY